VASIQARHTRDCALAKPWTPFALQAGCTCQPTYYVVIRDGTKLHRERAGKNRRQAERALTKIEAQIDDGAYQPQRTIRFADNAGLLRLLRRLRDGRVRRARRPSHPR
jgi:hypothetical protein